MVLLTFMKHLATELCVVVDEEPEDQAGYEPASDEDTDVDDGEVRIYGKKETWRLAWKRRNVPQTCSDADRRLCIICSLKTYNKCEQCDVHVHWDCWSRFHDLANPWMGHP